MLFGRQKMVTFVALYRGTSLQSAQLVAVTTDAELVAQVAAGLLKGPAPKDEDPVLAAVHGGRRRALRLLHQEATPSEVGA